MIASAATLACGLLGLREKLGTTEPLQGSAHPRGFMLPRSLHEALEQLVRSPALVELMGPRFVKAYVAVKEKEFEAYLRVISSWEREFLLLTV